MSKRGRTADGEQTIPGFLNGLLDGTVAADSQTLHLQGRALQKHDEGHILIVRSCYTALFEFVENELAPVEEEELHLQRYAVVTGTEGIGKTYFGLYVARIWFLLGRLVRFWYGDTCWIFVLSLEQHDWLREKMKACTLANGTSFWYLKGYNLKLNFKPERMCLCQKFTQSTIPVERR